MLTRYRGRRILGRTKWPVWGGRNTAADDPAGTLGGNRKRHSRARYLRAPLEHRSTGLSLLIAPGLCTEGVQIVLSNEQREFYFENGYLIIEGLLSGEKLARAGVALEERYVLEGDQAGSEARAGYSPGGVRRLANLFSKGQIWEEIAIEPVALEVARLTIGNEVRWNGMNFHDPIPGESTAHQAVHADRSIFPNCMGYMNVCWAIDDMTIENGATRLVPGSHKGPWPRDVLNEEEARDVIDGEIYTECPAGTAVFIHGDVWHGGRANYSQSTRRTLHLAFACPNAAPQCEIAGTLTSEIRARLGTHCALIPGTLESFGLSENWFM